MALNSSYNTLQISLKHQTESEVFSCHAFSTNFSPCVLLLSFPNVDIGVYLQMGDTYIKLGRE